MTKKEQVAWLKSSNAVNGNAKRIVIDRAFVVVRTCGDVKRRDMKVAMKPRI